MRSGGGLNRTSRGWIDRQWTRCLASLRRLGRRRTAVVLILAVLGFVGSAGLGLIRGVPIAHVHDEFAYLLAADTFSEGRLTNPTHQHWKHFETFHVIQRPTRQAKYPPAQGLLLAAGQTVTGYPAAGLWLGAGLLAGAAAWALLLWLPPGWGLMMALFCTVQLTWFSYWSQTYWGGTVAAIAGALLFGSFRALTLRPRMRHGIALGVALGIMATSRPFEGAIAGILVALALGAHLSRRRAKRLWRPLVQAVIPAGLSLGLLLGALGIYNHQVTGSAMNMPYQVHEEQYASAPTFLFQPATGPLPDYRHLEMERSWLYWGRERHELMRSLDYLPKGLTLKTFRNLLFFLGPGLVAFLGYWYPVPRAQNFKFPLIASAVVMVASLTTKASWPHYVAPVTVLFYVVMGIGLLAIHRRARWRRGPNASPLLIIACGFMVLVGLMAFLTSSPTNFQKDRQAVLSYLKQAPGHDLVIVSYEKATAEHREWVHNKADIDAAPVVWARSISKARNADLRAYFPDRTHWLLTVGDEVVLQRLPNDSLGTVVGPDESCV